MQVVNYGKTRQQTVRERNLDMILAYCRSRKSCGRKDEDRCPLARICGQRPYYLISDFTMAEIRDAMRLIAADGGCRE